MRLHDIDTFNPLLTLNPWTGKQNALTVHTLVRSLYRHNLARCLSRRVVPSVWGPFYDDDKAEMNFEAELKLANRLEQGFHVLFHMADISRDIKRGRQFHRKTSLSPSMSKRLTKLHKRLKEYSEINFDFDSPDSSNNYQKLLLPPDHTKSKSKTHHTTQVLKWAQTESEIGQRRLDFRANHLDEKSEVAFHCTLRMLRELLERILLRHGPRLWHRDTRNEYSVVSWFLLNQGPRDLAKLVLTPQDECCHHHFHPDPSTDGEDCLFSNPLDEYWDAWKDSPGLGCASAGTGACAGSGAGSGADTYTDMGIDIRLSRSIKMRIGKNSSSNANPNPNLNLNLNTSPSLSQISNPASNCDCKRRIRSWSVKPALFDNQGREYNRAAERYLKEMWGQRHVGLHQAFTMGIFATVF